MPWGVCGQVPLQTKTLAQESCLLGHSTPLSARHSRTCTIQHTAWVTEAWVPYRTELIRLSVACCGKPDTAVQNAELCSVTSEKLVSPPVEKISKQIKLILRDRLLSKFQAVFTGYHSVPDSFQPPSQIPSYDIAPPRMHHALLCSSAFAYALPTSWAALFICLAMSYSTIKTQPNITGEASPCAPSPRWGENPPPRLWAPWRQGQWLSIHSPGGGVQTPPLLYMTSHQRS